MRIIVSCASRPKASRSSLPLCASNWSDTDACLHFPHGALKQNKAAVVELDVVVVEQNKKSRRSRAKHHSQRFASSVAAGVYPKMFQRPPACRMARGNKPQEQHPTNPATVVGPARVELTAKGPAPRPVASPQQLADPADLLSWAELVAVPNAERVEPCEMYVQKLEKSVKARLTTLLQGSPAICGHNMDGELEAQQALPSRRVQTACSHSRSSGAGEILKKACPRKASTKRQGMCFGCGWTSPRGRVRNYPLVV